MIHVKFRGPAINISNNTESRLVLSVAFFKSNYALLSTINAHKFCFARLTRFRSKDHYKSMLRVMGEDDG